MSAGDDARDVIRRRIEHDEHAWSGKTLHPDDLESFVDDMTCPLCGEPQSATVWCSCEEGPQ